MKNILNLTILALVPFSVFSEEDHHHLNLKDSGAAGPVRAYLITTDAVTLTILPSTPPGVSGALPTADYIFQHTLKKSYLPSAQTNTTITYTLNTVSDYDTLQEVYFIGNEQITTRQTGSVICYSFLKAFSKKPTKNEVEKFLRERFIGFEKIDFTEGIEIKDDYVIYSVKNEATEINWHYESQVVYKNGELSITFPKNGIFSVYDVGVQFDDSPETNKNFFSRNPLTKPKSSGP